jgi:cytochrome c
VRSLIALCLAFCLVGHGSPAFADKDMLQKNNCFACHSIDKRKYGPKLVEVAKKYAGDTDAAQVLARKIQAGGTGVWGEDIMPPQPQVSDEEALALAKYILSLP